MALPEEDARDHESGDDEEHVHPEESPVKTREIGVIPDNQRDGQCPQGLNVGTKGPRVLLRHRAGQGLKLTHVFRR